jgi:hypothetical protein
MNTGTQDRFGLRPYFGIQASVSDPSLHGLQVLVQSADIQYSMGIEGLLERSVDSE